MGVENSPSSAVMGYPVRSRPWKDDSYSLLKVTTKDETSDSYSPKATTKDETYEECCDPPINSNGIICIIICLVLLGLVLVPAFLACTHDGPLLPPEYRVEYASVSLTTLNSCSTTTSQVAEWNIGFSVHNPGGQIEFEDLSVSVTSLSGSSPITLLSGYLQPGFGKRVMLNATIRGVLPQFNTTHVTVLPFNLDLETQLRFTNSCIPDRLFTSKTRCSVMKIQLHPSQTQGTVLEVPFPCNLNFFKASDLIGRQESRHELRDPVSFEREFNVSRGLGRCH